MSAPTSEHQGQALTGRRIALVGRLASMSRREAEKLIRAQGGEIVSQPSADSDLIVVADDVADLQRLESDEQLFDDNARAAIAGGELEVMRESDFWARLGLVDTGPEVQRLYTLAMLADLVRVPVATVRQWHRIGALRATRELRRLAYFDFDEVRVARKLAQLHAAGCSLSTIRRKLAELDRLMSAVPRPLADAAVVVAGSCLYVRRGENLAEPSGQLLIDFDAPPADADVLDAGPIAIPFTAAATTTAPRAKTSHPYAANDLRSLAAELEESGRRDQAIEVYRAILVSGEFTAEDHFALAELLYRESDLPAARERYYTAIELDEDYVEARANLGCVLAELGDYVLAEAAFRGAIEYHPDYADAHYQLARLLDRLDQSEEALHHWRRFMELAPASPWSDDARIRLGGAPCE